MLEKRNQVEHSGPDFLAPGPKRSTLQEKRSPRKTQAAVVIYPDGREEIQRPAAKGEFTLAELQKMVGGYIEAVPLKQGNGRMTAYCNEEGKLERLPLNAKATARCALAAYDCIVGNLALISSEETMRTYFGHLF